MIFFCILQCFIIFCGAEICSDQRGVSRLNLAARSKRASVRKFAALQTLRSHFCGFIVARNEGGIFGRLANGEFTIIKSSGRKRKSQEGPFIFLPINLNFECVCAKGRGSGCAAPGRGSLLRGSKSGVERGGPSPWLPKSWDYKARAALPCGRGRPLARKRKAKRAPRELDFALGLPAGLRSPLWPRGRPEGSVFVPLP